MTQKTFILGLGAPKSGSTWLYRYIDALPASNMGCRKEYRFWNSYFRDGSLKQRFNFYRLMKWKHGLPTPDRSQFVRLAMILRAGYYERYFDGLVDDTTWLTGDISPSYMLPDADQLREVRTRLEKVGFRIKVIFLMRDPVERCLSGARMRKRNRDKGFETLSDAAAVQAIFRTEGVAARTRYDRTIAAVEQVFDPEDVFMSLYEELFTPAQVDRLSAFLGVPANHDMISQRFNQTQRDGELDPQIVTEIKAYFSDVYSVCHARFPASRDLWI